MKKILIGAIAGFGGGIVLWLIDEFVFVGASTVILSTALGILLFQRIIVLPEPREEGEE